MSIEWLRDLVIVILGFVSIIVLIVIGILFFGLYRRVKRLITLIHQIIAAIKDSVRGARRTFPRTASSKGGNK